VNGYHIVDFAVREYGFAIALVVLFIVALIVVSRLTRRSVEKWYDYHLHDLAPARAKNMIAHRDQKIERLEERIRELEKEKRSLVDATRAAALFADRTREILTQPEVIRLRGTTEPGYSLKRRNG